RSNMMDMLNDDDPPPGSKDLEGWRRVVRGGIPRKFRLEAIVAAIQDLGPNSDKEVIHALAKHLSDALMHLLRRYVSTSHPNRGDDVIYRAYGLIVDALLRPDSADGKALRRAFAPRVKFRIADAIVSERRAARKPTDRVKKKAASKISKDGKDT